MKLFIDDVRPTPEGFDFRAYSSTDAIFYIDSFDIDFISFDHDLGGDDTGYKVACYIEKIATEGKCPPDYKIHSANPVGAERIKLAMESAHKIFFKSNS